MDSGQRTITNGNKQDEWLAKSKHATNRHREKAMSRSDSLHPISSSTAAGSSLQVAISP